MSDNSLCKRTSFREQIQKMMRGPRLYKHKITCEIDPPVIDRVSWSNGGDIDFTSCVS